jgi:hypothetical protein
MKLRSLAFLSVLAALPLVARAAPIDLGSRLELMVDHHLIDRLDGVSLRLQVPQKAGVALP